MTEDRPTPHLLHVTSKGAHLHWAPGSTREEIQRTGRAARLFLGKNLVRRPTDPPMTIEPGFYRFGAGEKGEPNIGGRRADA